MSDDASPRGDWSSPSASPRARRRKGAGVQLAASSSRPLAPGMSFRNEKDRMLPADQRRLVYMSVAMDVLRIDVPSQSFTVSAFINFYWHETPEALARLGVDLAQPRWRIEDDSVSLPINPKIKMFDNGVALKHLSPSAFSYNAELGVVHWRLNVEAELTERLELARFPFDRQLLTAHINIRTAQWRLLTEAPAYVPDVYGQRRPATYRLAPSVSDWTPHRPTVDYRGVFPRKPKISVRVERQSHYFLVSVVLPLFLIVALSFLSFAVDRAAGFHERASLVLTLLLTSVALKFSVDDRLPATNYLTLMDRYIVLSWGVMSLVAATHAATQYLHDEALADRVDFYGGFGLAAAWLLLHLVLVLAAATGCVKRSWSETERTQVETMEPMEPFSVLGLELTPEEAARLERQSSRRPASVVLEE